jgi:N2-acetyl-L-2,4-diaminobutanoate deacetylase
LINKLDQRRSKMATELQPWLNLAPGDLIRTWWEPGVAGLSALPVLAARGVRDGPFTLITGGVHGDEYEGPAAIQALFADLATADLAGLVVGLPVVNVAAWQAHSRVSPLDGLDLNRFFAGSAPPDAAPSRQLAERLFTTFVRPCDVLVDLHSGGARLVHLPMIGWYEEDEQAERLARTFGEDLLPWLIPDVSGVLSCEAYRAGKVALGAEYGGGAGLSRAGVAAYTTGLRRILALLGGEEAQAEGLDTRRAITGSYQTVETGGLFVAHVNLGDHVTPTTAIGQLYNLLGEPVAEVQAARPGIVAALAHRAWLQPGDRVAYVG